MALAAAKSKRSIDAEIMMVTPEMASEWLSNNAQNRNISVGRVKTMERDIREGRFPLNGETIKVSVTGKLLDGQHRLTAIVRAERPVECLVVTGLPDEVMTSIDQGRSRSNGDVLHMQGVHYAAQCATTAKLLWEYRNFGTMTGSLGASRTNVLKEYEASKEEIDVAATLANQLQFKTGMPMVAAMVASVLIARRSERLSEFWGEYVDLERWNHNQEESPVKALRRYISDKDRRLISSKTVGTILKAWNSWVMKKPMKVASYRIGEPFPEIAKG